MKVTLIADKTHPALLEILRCATTEKVIAVDLEGDLRSNGTMSLMQVAFGPGNKAYILDLYTCPELLTGQLAKVLESTSIVKVFHDCRNDARALKGQFGVSLKNVFDTQAAHFILSNLDKKQAQVGLNLVLATYAGKQNTHKAEVVHRSGLWEQRPLPNQLLDYAAQDVLNLVAVYHNMKRMVGGNKDVLAKIEEKSMQMATPPQATAFCNSVLPGSAIERTPANNRKEQHKRAKELLKDTCKAFLGHLQANTANVNVETLPQTFDDWKRAEMLEGRQRKGGRAKILLWAAAQTAKKSASNKAVETLGGNATIEQAAKQVESSRAALEANKGGVEISCIDQSEVIPVGTRRTLQLTIQNNGKSIRHLVSVKLLRTDRADFEVLGAQLPLLLPPSANVKVELDCKPKWQGVVCNTLCFSFGSFSISRFLEFRCGDASLLDDLKPTAPYVGRTTKALRQPKPSSIVPAPSVSKRGGTKVQALPLHTVPKEFGEELALGEIEDALEEGMAAMASSERRVALQAYSRHWQTLLWAEEVQLARDLAMFNLTGGAATVLSKRSTAELELHVQGLAEKRPSIIKGDKVRVNLCCEPAKAWEGVVTSIHREEVGLSFSSAFHQRYQPGMRVEVVFVINRMPLRICHEGVKRAPQLPPQVLFPLPPLAPHVPRIDGFEPINPHVAANPSQRAAVLAILQGVCRPVPYILFGPPGTGKTTTLVEAVIQCLRCPSMPAQLKVLVCASTNTAADVVCERIASLGAIASRTEMLRLMAHSRSEHQVAPPVLPFTVKDDEGSFVLPSVHDLKSCRVVVSSLGMAGKLHSVGVQRGHFDIIFIDEAGQAVEPEAVAPVASLLGAAGQLVLAGDVKQLGPVIRSPLANKFGLQTSLIERLMLREVYNKDIALFPHTLGYDPRVLTKLEWNFRSHPALLQLPNALFYDGELKSKANPLTVNNCLAWDGLEKPGVPMVFEGVEGRDEREANSPSWFNADEAVIVLRYVEALMRARLRVKVQQTDIGVITPYNKQVHKIQGLLRRECLGDVKVGSTEMFQGAEKRIIIISTVRSSRDFITWDRKHQLGFLDNPKRFNVAITRAACLLIVVGNPIVLAGDACWGRLLRHCVAQNVYRGVPLPDLDRGGESANNQSASEQADLLEALSQLFLDDDAATPASNMILHQAVAMPEDEA